MKKGTGIFKQLFHLSSRSRTPKRPPPLLSNDIGHSSNQQPVSVPHVLSSLNSTGLPAPSGERRGNKAAWAALKTSLGLLYESANAFGSLKSVIGGISQCIDIFERAAKSREDYETLATDLDTICQDLCGYLDGFAPPAMMSNIDSLAK
ncbi:hypothetical protein BDV93DRAFT_512595 [Ceratobasidium sp. AG-I]|nr:hypothetical protein BDV93DRAFT_512595 [Ceratobasidium sp. AG-I]